MQLPAIACIAHRRKACTHGGSCQPSRHARTSTATDEDASCSSATREALPWPLSGRHSCIDTILYIDFLHCVRDGSQQRRKLCDRGCLFERWKPHQVDGDHAVCH